jgi:glucan phosphoethanolaminetransferase (alkaline phosphatase superfamily)
MNFKYAGPTPEWLSVLAIYWAIFLAILWFIFACAVWTDACRIEKNGYRLRFLSPFWWFLIVLGFTLPGAALYWVSNCSTLANLARRDESGTTTAEQGSGLKGLQP